MKIHFEFQNHVRFYTNFSNGKALAKQIKIKHSLTKAFIDKITDKEVEFLFTEVYH